MKLAILDDYQGVALNSVDWSEVSKRVDITVFKDHLHDEDLIAERLENFEIICAMWERTPFPRSLFLKLPNLRLLVSSGMRNLGIDVDSAKERGIIVCGTKSVGRPTAELAWGFILGLARNISKEDENVKHGRWQSSVGMGLEGKTLGIAGLGNLGKRMAEIGKAFKMNIIAWSKNLTEERCLEVGAKLVTKEELMKKSDIITIHLILSDRSRRTFGKKELNLMKPSAYIINTSRGPIIDEEELVNVLKKNTIAGAGIDVFSIEPLPENNPFISLKNILLTPHLGYVEGENYLSYFKGYIEAVTAFLDGKPKNFISGY